MQGVQEGVKEKWLEPFVLSVANLREKNIV